MTPADFIPLRITDVQRGLTTRHLGRPLHLFDALASTSATAFTLARSGAGHGTAVLAESQTAGVGRQSRPWVSPPRRNLACSVILSTPALLAHVSWIPLVTGLALIEAAHQASGLALSLKWPNDLLCADKKTGGVLCESASHGARLPVCVMGFGINVNARLMDFPLPLRSLVTSLREETQRDHDRNALLAAVLNRLEYWYDLMESGPFDPIRQAYAASCGTLGRDVRVTCVNGQPVRGTAVDIDSDGALLVTTRQGNHPRTVAIRSADVDHLR
ncbi:MAG: biotin--[acetyl-CoA-carboxylase] ligase [Nitrospira sp.]|nr:biotin--[acetyl-CoA-carboxylase] ligase [Nitrospira sp.]